LFQLVFGPCSIAHDIKSSTSAFRTAGPHAPKDARFFEQRQSGDLGGETLDLDAAEKLER
jgi:hypothetical protein